MTSKTKKLLDEALRLPPEEREVLAGRLYNSLDADEADAETAWQAEVERRIREIDEGLVMPVPWAEAERLIFGESDDPAGD